MCQFHLPAALLLLLPATYVFAQEPATGLRVVDFPDRIEVFDDDSPVLTYQRATKSRDGKWPRANYVHPLYDLDGNVLTEDFPDDHGHHRGIFWAWHQVIANGKPVGDAWLCRDFAWDVQSTQVRRRAGFVSIFARVHWTSPDFVDNAGNKQPFAEEATTIRVHSLVKGRRLIDFDIRIQPLVDGLRIGGSDDVKGYGGFSPRIRLTPEQSFVSEIGRVEPQKLALEAGTWMDISDGKVGVAILTHPTNPNHPQPWILRRGRSMQNAVYPGRTPVAIPRGKPLALRYRLVVHRGTAEEAKIDRLQASYAKSK